MEQKNGPLSQDTQTQLARMEQLLDERQEEAQNEKQGEQAPIMGSTVAKRRVYLVQVEGNPNGEELNAVAKQVAQALTTQDAVLAANTRTHLTVHEFDRDADEHIEVSSCITPYQIARVCHEVNRAYARSLGDFSHAPWEEVSPELQQSALSGVLENLKFNLTSEETHQRWMDYKIKQGWTLGEVKDEKLKTHPSLKPYKDLTLAEQTKDSLFQAVTRTMRAYLPKLAEPTIKVQRLKNSDWEDVDFKDLKAGDMFKMFNAEQQAAGQEEEEKKEPNTYVAKSDAYPDYSTMNPTYSVMADLINLDEEESQA